MVTEWPTGTDVVTIALHDRVAVITFNQPERRNAIHHEMHAPITRALEEFATRDDVGVIVLTGAGSAFCAGGDVKGDLVARSKLEPAERVEALLADAQVVRRLYEHPKLTIAAVNGPAVGAGMALALACDLRIAAASAILVTGWAGSRSRATTGVRGFSPGWSARRGRSSCWRATRPSTPTPPATSGW